MVFFFQRYMILILKIGKVFCMEIQMGCLDGFCVDVKVWIVFSVMI